MKTGNKRQGLEISGKMEGEGEKHDGVNEEVKRGGADGMCKQKKIAR